MAKFTVRVELHAADSFDYELLHAAMELEGFKRFIEDSTGSVVHLPPGEYNLVADWTKSDVLRAAKSAANKVVTSFSILVTESAGRTWCNLDLD